MSDPQLQANCDAISEAKIAATKAKLVENAELFEDPDFPAVISSIYYSKDKQSIEYEWKRPKEICANAKFLSDGASRFDIQQGKLGDCWLLASLSSLAMHPQLFSLVVPNDQEFTGPDYCGLIRFRFWQFGEWIDVIIDDRLPTRYNRLVFMRSTDLTEFWSALLEKAYAKMVGSYEALCGGNAAEAMEDFTGGIVETFKLPMAQPMARPIQPEKLLQILLRAVKLCSLMSCSVMAQDGKIERRLDNGLVTGHSYSVTDVKIISKKESSEAEEHSLSLVRIRNPWGDGVEWKGAWSDGSPEWTALTQEEKDSLGLRFDKDGEFWMTFADFCSNFSVLQICHLGPDSHLAAVQHADDAEHKQQEQQQQQQSDTTRWVAVKLQGAWRRGANAGGCRNFVDTFWTNPQYRIRVPAGRGAATNIIVGLLQKTNTYKRRRVKGCPSRLRTIGFAIYSLAGSRHPSDELFGFKFFKAHRIVANSPAFINSREVCGRYELSPGEYLIVPSTFGPGEEAEYLLRVFSELPCECAEVDVPTELATLPAPSVPVIDDIHLREAFDKFSDQDKEMDVFALRKLLTTFKQEFNKFEKFSLETCRCMVALVDADQSGKLCFYELKALLSSVAQWTEAFDKFQSGVTGTFDSSELRMALNCVGLRVSNQLLNCLVMRHAGKNGEIDVNDFVTCCARLSVVAGIFRTQAKDEKTGRAAFSLDEFLQAVMYV